MEVVHYDCTCGTVPTVLAGVGRTFGMVVQFEYGIEGGIPVGHGEGQIVILCQHIGTIILPVQESVVAVDAESQIHLRTFLPSLVFRMIEGACPLGLGLQSEFVLSALCTGVARIVGTIACYQLQHHILLGHGVVEAFLQGDGVLSLHPCHKLEVVLQTGIHPYRFAGRVLAHDVFMIGCSGWNRLYHQSVTHWWRSIGVWRVGRIVAIGLRHGRGGKESRQYTYYIYNVFHYSIIWLGNICFQSIGSPVPAPLGRALGYRCRVYFITFLASWITTPFASLALMR